MATVAVLATAGFVSFVLLTSNLQASPDVVWDEVVYSIAGQNVLSQDRLAWGPEPIHVHPPLFFLTIAGWQLLSGRADAPMLEQITVNRVMTNVSTSLVVVLVGAMVLMLASRRALRWRLALAAAAMLIVAVDPTVQRYGRLVYIDSLAILLGVAVVLLSLRLRTSPVRWPGSRRLRPLSIPYPAAYGTLAGLALLTKEVAVLYVAAPLLAALLIRDRERARRQASGIGIALGLWLVFPLWAVVTGSTSGFFDEKLITVRRVLGLLQTSGWNRDGVSIFGWLAIEGQTYGATYVLLAIGGVALLWAAARSQKSEQVGTLASLLVLNYAFVGYSMLFGQANEQFAMYAVIPAAIGAVMLLDAALAGVSFRRRPLSAAEFRSLCGATAVAAVMALVGVLAVTSWVQRYVASPDQAFQDMVSYIDTHLPDCAVVNGSGDVYKYRGVVDNRISEFTEGPEALAYGIQYFLVSNVDAERLYGTMSPEFASWIRNRGRLLVEFQGETYGRLGLYQVQSPWNDPDSDLVATGDGLFTNTWGSACGGHLVGIDGAGTAYYALGGKPFLGRARSSVFARDGDLLQLYDAGLVRLGPDPQLLPIVSMLHDLEGGTWARRGITVDNNRDFTDAVGAAKIWGTPAGPPTVGSDGSIVQAFERGVLRLDQSARLETAPIAAAVIESGTIPERALRPQHVPDLFPEEQDQSAPASIFATLLIGSVVAVHTVPRLRGRLR